MHPMPNTVQYLTQKVKPLAQPLGPTMSKHKVIAKLQHIGHVRMCLQCVFTFRCCLKEECHEKPQGKDQEANKFMLSNCTDGATLHFA